MINTLELWRGPFGHEYHARNVFDAEQIKPFFQRILERAEVRSVLEVGAGNGHNLLALDDGKRVLAGVEPNPEARARATAEGLAVSDGDILDLVFSERIYDLVFTCGVLIHVPPADIEQAMTELVRVSRKYVLAVEYFAPKETETPYRGQRDVLWTRPYGELYEQLGLTVYRHEPADSELFPGCQWWLCRK